MLAQLRQEHTRIEDAGASVAVVVMGSAQAAGAFRDERALPFDCYADPGRSAYAAFGLRTAGVATWAGPRTLVRAAALFRKGIAVGLPHPGQDVRQMPGTFVVARGGTVRLAHYNRDPSDNPRVGVVLGALGAT